jgi:hypothetical protein
MVIMKTQIEILTETVDRLVKESINEMLTTEILTNEKNSKSEEEGEEPKNHSKKNTKVANRRKRVIKWLKDPTVNCAEIMRKLWNPEKKKEDAARSYFYKCRDGELNDSGVEYSFSDKDINKLYAIMNNLKS